MNIFSFFVLLQSRGELCEVAELPDPADLVTISQSRCSASDLLRMEAILATKLENKQQQVSPVTILVVTPEHPFH